MVALAINPIELLVISSREAQGLPPQISAPLALATLERAMRAILAQAPLAAN